MLEMACNDEGRGDPIGVIKSSCSSPNSFFRNNFVYDLFQNLKRRGIYISFLLLTYVIELLFIYDELVSNTWACI